MHRRRHVAEPSLSREQISKGLFDDGFPYSWYAASQRNELLDNKQMQQVDSTRIMRQRHDILFAGRALFSYRRRRCVLAVGYICIESHPNHVDLKIHVWDFEQENIVSPAYTCTGPHVSQSRSISTRRFTE